MRSPKSLDALADHGIIQEVVRPLMSGKEAQVYMVVSGDRVCAAKIYKESQNRSFKHRADYTEGRKVRNTRDQRAMAKGSKYGKSKDEDAWRTTEVDIIYRLRAAGVRVPEPLVFIDGVLLMELVCDDDGNPAPRLGDVGFTPREATEIFHAVLQEVVRMLCAGIVHGDLSDFNILLSHDGPVIIDFPQSVEAAGNLNARRLLVRDIDNLQRFLSRFVPGTRHKPYGEELWSLYENNRLTPETRLTGAFKRAGGPVDTRAVQELIGDANREEMRRRSAQQAADKGAAVPMRRREVIIEKPVPRDPRPNGTRRPGGPGGGFRGNAPSGGPRDDRRSFESRRPGLGRGPQAGHPGQKKKSGPKRGDGVQSSSYVSPEARKTKAFTLTPRAATQEGNAPRSAPGSRPEQPRARRNDPAERRTHSRESGGRHDSKAPPKQSSSRAHSEQRDRAQLESSPLSDRRARARARREERKGGPTNHPPKIQAGSGKLNPSDAPRETSPREETQPRRRRRRRRVAD